MLFFYGGAYAIGSAEMYPGDDLAITGDVIVVTTNYRVGVMGFLSSGEWRHHNYQGCVNLKII